MKGSITETNRIYYIDNLRTFLIILVVLQHVAIIYGGFGSFYYYEHTNNSVANALLTMLVAINQSFSMGLFFMISGYFTPIALNRKGIKLFIKDRLFRLGIPLIIYLLTFSPILEYIKELTVNSKDYKFLDYYKHEITIGLNIAPGALWFVETLLFFNAFYIIWTLFKKKLNPQIKCNKTEVLSSNKILCLIILLMIGSFTTRIWFPVGNEYYHLQIGYFFQYITMFIIGILAYQKKWLDYLYTVNRYVWTTITILTIAIFPVVILLCGGLQSDISLFFGGLNIKAVILATWDSFICVGMSISLLLLFYKKFNFQNRITKIMKDNYFTVYIVHSLLVVLIAYSLKNIHFNPLIKFTLVSVIGILISFLTGHLIVRHIPYIKNVI